ncbi:MAG: hypothetical protein U0992_18870 [Planctomycetaceae bacterium]
MHFPRRHRRSRFDYRNPPPFWRCVYAGATLAMPGAIAGMIVAVFVHAGAAAVWFGAAGFLLGFFAGFRMEKH